MYIVSIYHYFVFCFSREICYQGEGKGGSNVVPSSALFMSLTVRKMTNRKQMTNKRGPRIDPWGTPLGTENELDMKFLS